MHKCYLLVEDSSKLPQLSQEKHILPPVVLQGPFYDLCKTRPGGWGALEDNINTPLIHINIGHSSSHLLSIKFIIIVMLKLKTHNKIRP